MNFWQTQAAYGFTHSLIKELKRIADALEKLANTDNEEAK